MLSRVQIWMYMCLSKDKMRERTQNGIQERKKKKSEETNEEERKEINRK